MSIKIRFRQGEDVTRLRPKLNRMVQAIDAGIVNDLAGPSGGFYAATMVTYTTTSETVPFTDATGTTTATAMSRAWTRPHSRFQLKLSAPAMQFRSSSPGQTWEQPDPWLT